MSFREMLPKIAVLLLAAVFVFAAVTIIVTKAQTKKMEKKEQETAEIYTRPAEPVDVETPEGRKLEGAPIVVDFDALKQENGDVVGWLYCEDTPLNYPLLQTDDNSYYLKHTFAGYYSDIGAIFVDYRNRPGFIDKNTIIYGHHMPNGTMLTCVENWDSQEYYEAHRSLYLLTPDGDYMIDVIAGYVTPATSDTYTVVYNSPKDNASYLQKILAKSVFTSDVEADPEANYILLSTCSHEYDEARAVLHGKLVKLDSVGGVIAGQQN